MLKRHYGHSSARHIAGLWLVNSRVKMGSWSDPSPIQYIHVYRYRYLHIPKYVCIYIYNTSTYIPVYCIANLLIHTWITQLQDPQVGLPVTQLICPGQASIICDRFPNISHLFFWAIIHHIRWGRLGWLLGLSQSLQEWAPEIISWFTHPPNCQHMQIYHSTSVIKPSWPSYKPTCLSGDHFRCRAFHLEVCHSHGLIEGLGKAVPPIEVITPQS